MKIFDKYRKEKKKEFMSHVSDEVKDRFDTGKEITSEEHSNIKMNSYERRLLFPLYSDELLLQLTQYFMDQHGVKSLGRFEISANYGDAILKQQLPELIKRFKNLKESNLYAKIPNGDVLLVVDYDPKEDVYYVEYKGALLAYEKQDIKLFREIF